MEVKRKKTLKGMFFRYICLFCVNALVQLAFVVLLFLGLSQTGVILPANYMEKQIEEKAESIEASDENVEELLPPGCNYGVYSADGTYKYGAFAEKEQERAWNCYKNGKKAAGGGGYYRFISRNVGDICIVKYHLVTQFAPDSMAGNLPSPTLLLLFLYVVLFLLQAVLLSRHFGKSLSRRLCTLNDTTEKIRNQDLEFEQAHSDIKEIEEVLDSLYQMKCALKNSLEQQWEAQESRKEQIAALVHDIKTPLTVIKGSAELLAEGDCEGQREEYHSCILRNVKEIENYLALLQEVLMEEKKQHETETIDCREVAERFICQAKMLALGRHVKAMAQTEDVEGKIQCNFDQMMRAWNNLVSNALEYTPDGGSIWIEGRAAENKGKRFLALSVIDQGPGFTSEGLRHATEQFYQGDKSRHRKEHRGLGLYIAAEFAKAQGGEVLLENETEAGYGARVTLLMRVGSQRECS